MTLKAQAIREKNKQVELHQYLKFLCTKEHNQESERQWTEWKNLFANPILDTCLVYRIYREPYNWRTENNPIQKNGQRIWIDFSPKKIIQMANRHVKRCSTSLDTREM